MALGVGNTILAMGHLIPILQAWNHFTQGIFSLQKWMGNLSGVLIAVTGSQIVHTTAQVLAVVLKRWTIFAHGTLCQIVRLCIEADYKGWAVPLEKTTLNSLFSSQATQPYIVSMLSLLWRYMSISNVQLRTSPSTPNLSLLLLCKLP